MEQAESIHLGINIGGTESSAILGSAGGEILRRRTWPTNASQGLESAINSLFAEVKLLLGGSSPVSAGVAIGGPLDAAHGIVQSPPNLPGWDNVPLKRIIEERLNLPTNVEHDAAACALAEYRWGTPRHANRLLYLTCGTGFGVGFVSDGRSYRGANGLNCEIGHARYAPDGPTAFCKTGSIEAFCAAGSLGRLANWMFPARFSECMRGEELAAFANAGDVDANAVLTRNAHAVGDVAALLADLLRPDYIALGSLAMHLGNSWVQEVRSRFLHEVLPATSQTCVIAPASLAGRLQDLSALAVALSSKEQ